MAGRWSLHLFDWDRFHQLSPRLRAAAASDDFGHLNDDEADDLLDQLDESAAPEEVCNLLLLHLCISAESTTFDKGLPELVLWMRRRENTEDASETLGALLSKGCHVEDWFACESGLMGILTEVEVEALERRLEPFRAAHRPALRPGGFGALVRLFSTVDPALESVGDLLAIVREAADRRMGLAAVLEV